jgi:hypothetical protein
MTETKPADVNPLLEASSKSLDELFSRDPAGYTQQDLEAVVAELRRMAAKWQQEEASGATKSKTGASVAKALKQQVNGLDDLGL